MVRPGNHRCSCLVGFAAAHDPASLPRAEDVEHHDVDDKTISRRLFMKVGSYSNVWSWRRCRTGRRFFYPRYERTREPLSSVGYRSNRRPIPEGETRLANVSESVCDATDGKTADTACWVGASLESNSRFSPSNCAHLGCPLRGSRSPGCSCALVTEVRITKMGRVPRPAGAWIVRVSVQSTERPLVTIQAGELPTPGASAALLEKAAMRLIAQIGEWFDRRLQLAAPIREIPSIRPRNTAVGVWCLEALPSSYSSATRHRNYAGINYVPPQRSRGTICRI